MRTALLTLALFGLCAAHGQAGTVDPTFNAQMGSPEDSVSGAVALPDGKVIIAGSFTVVQGVARKRVARLFSDGTLDMAFDPGDGPNAPVSKVLVQPDGHILLRGGFTSYGGTPKARLARIMADGALDPTFDAGTGPTGGTYGILDWTLQPDGRLLLAGDLTAINGTAQTGVARLLSNGAVDPAWSFGSGTGAGQLGNYVNCLAIQSNGRILIGGYFESVQGTACRSFARLFPNGGVESSFSFNQTLGFTMNNGALLGQVFSIQVLPDGNILVGGAFEEYSGAASGPLVKIASSGLRDITFTPFPAYTFSGNHVRAMRALPDGRCIVMNIGGTIKRIQTNGSNDPTFTSYSSSGFSYYFSLQSDGCVLLTYPLLRLRGDASGALPVALKVLLGGPFDAGTGLMNDALRVAGLIPQAQPYTMGSGYTQVGGGGNERMPPWLLSTTGPNAIVDWVMVELRDQPTHVAMTRCGLVQRDGDVVGMDGISPLYFLASAGDYRVAVRHRNHLGVMTANAATLSTSPTVIDLTLPTTATYGTTAQNQTGPKMVLWAGHTNFDTTVKYTGSANDRDVVLTAVGSTTPNNTVTNVYDRRDTNLDGVIKYTGPGNDRDIILTNVGSTTPNNTRTQQLP
jgi:uncharacterized delta-60 repeat protein